MKDARVLGIVRICFLAGFLLYISIIITKYFLQIASEKCAGAAGILTCWPIEEITIFLPPLIFLMGLFFIYSSFKVIIKKKHFLVFSLGTLTLLWILLMFTLTPLYAFFRNWYLPIIYPIIYLFFYTLFVYLLPKISNKK